jgi:hypothetical protein
MNHVTKDGMLGFADALVAAGYPREADTSLLGFAKRCGDSDAIHCVAIMRY